MNTFRPISKVYDTAPLDFVQQTDNSCVLACIAMVARLTLEEVEDLYPEFDGEGVNSANSHTILRRANVFSVEYTSSTNMLFWGRLYLVAVPSLSELGRLHQIVVDQRFEDENGYPIQFIFDPNKGYKGRRCYGNGEGEIPLSSWTEVIEIII